MTRECYVLDGVDVKRYSINDWEELLPFQEEIKLKGFREIKCGEHHISFLTCPFKICGYSNSGTLKKPVATLLGVEVGGGKWC